MIEYHAQLEITPTLQACDCRLSLAQSLSQLLLGKSRLISLNDELENDFPNPFASKVLALGLRIASDGLIDQFVNRGESGHLMMLVHWFPFSDMRATSAQARAIRRFCCFGDFTKKSSHMALSWSLRITKSAR